MDSNFAQEIKDDEIDDINDSLDINADMENVYIKKFKEENDTLLISNFDEKVYLPYSKEEIELYLDMFSDKYQTAKEVVDNEFTFPLQYFSETSYLARFREAYALYKDREGKSVIESIKFAFKQMKNSSLQPAIIAACRTLDELDVYIDCLDKNELEDFKIFKIKYELYPMVVRQSHEKEVKEYKESSGINLLNSLKNFFQKIIHSTESKDML